MTMETNFYDPGNYDGSSYNHGFDDGEAKGRHEATRLPQLIRVRHPLLHYNDRTVCGCGQWEYPLVFGYEVGWVEHAIAAECERLGR